MCGRSARGVFEHAVKETQSEESNSLEFRQIYKDFNWKFLALFQCLAWYKSLALS